MSNISQKEYEELILVEEGTYTVSYLYHYPSNYKGRQKKANFVFSIVSPEVHAGKKLTKYYNVDGYSDEGRIAAVPKSDIARDILRIDPNLGEAMRPDRLPVSVFKGKLLRVRVATITEDGRGDVLARPSQYSKIEAILGVEDMDSNGIENYGAMDDQFENAQLGLGAREANDEFDLPF